MKVRLPKVVFASLWSLAACMSGGGGNNNVDDSNVTITSISQYFQVIETQNCGEAFNCMSSFVPVGSGDTFSGDFGASVSACVTAAVGQDMPSIFETEVSANRASFSTTAATQCVQQTVEPAACTDYWNNGPTQPDVCNGVFVGLVADGAACQLTLDCTDLNACCINNICDTGSGSGSGSAGVPSWQPGHLASWFVSHEPSSSASD